MTRKTVGGVLLLLGSAQFLMTLDSSVMNVSMASIAADLGTTITGIQTAIALYTLVMAAFMITGGRLGAIMGRRRAFVTGLCIYAVGALTTSLAPNLAVLILGWSILEGIGAVLILPAVVSLIAGNFGPGERPRAFGMIAAASAIAVALGPVIGGFATSVLSWRYVFAGEVVFAAVIVLMASRLEEGPPATDARQDPLGTLLSALGLVMIVLGALRSTEWGFIAPNAGAPQLLGISLSLWLVVGGLVVLVAFWLWERRVELAGGQPLVRPSMLRNRQLRSGLTVFFFQYFVEGGGFFIVPVFFSIALGLSAIETGLRILPLSIALLAAAIGVPRLLPHASPRRIVQASLLLITLSSLLLVLAIGQQLDDLLVTFTMVLFGLGSGALASQLGSVTVSAVREEQSSAVGGLQQTATNLGLSLGTAIAGSVLIASLSAGFVNDVSNDPSLPPDVLTEIDTQFPDGLPFVSTTELESALTENNVPADTTAQIVAINSAAQDRALQVSVLLLGVLAALALVATRHLPDRQPGDALASAEPG